MTNRKLYDAVLLDGLDEEEGYDFLREFSIQSARHNDRVLRNSYAVEDGYAIEVSDDGFRAIIDVGDHFLEEEI